MSTASPSAVSTTIRTHGGTTNRRDYNRWNDQGINILEFGADPSGVADSTAAIQAAIDYAFTHNNAGTTVTAGQGVNNVFCPSGIYKISYPIFFDPPGSMRGSGTPAYDPSTTYAKDAVVYYNGIPWVSLVDSNKGNTPTTRIGIATRWRSTTKDVVQFSYSATLHGPPGLTPQGNRGAACQFSLTYNNDIGLWTGAGNGVVIDSISVNGANGNLQTGAFHHCGLPWGIGIGVPGDGGGANRTKLVNVGVINMYEGIAVSTNVNGGGLGAENKIIDPFITNACIGIAFWSLQNYINYVIGGDVCATTGLYMNSSNQGVTVEGGNWSCEDSTEPATSFAMSSVSATTPSGNYYTVTAKLALNGDPYMIHSCSSASDCGANNISGGSIFASNVYNAFTMKTEHYGIIPFQLVAFNASTGIATFRTIGQWSNQHDNIGLGDLATDLNAVTTVYAAEMVTVFDGAGITATNIHIENSSNLSGIVATRLINSWYGYGGNRTNTLTDIFFNYDPSGLAYMTEPKTAKRLATFYAMQTFDFITVQDVDLVIDSLNPANGDYLNVSLESAKLTWHNNATLYGSAPINLRSFSYYIAGDYNFTSQYRYAGTPGFGYGYFDFPPTSPGAYDSDVFRNNGWQQTPAWGYRPAPWTTPCIAPSQYAQLQSVPAITHTDATAQTITSGTYDPFTGRVQLYLSGDAGVSVGTSITVSGATGTGDYGSINGTWPARGGSSVAFQIATGLTMTITGGTVQPNWHSYSVSYPLIYGSQQYRQCDWQLVPTAYDARKTYAQGNLVSDGGTVYYSLINSNTGNTPSLSLSAWAPFHYGFISDHLGWSYGQDLTTTNVPGLTWSSRYGSDKVYLADSSFYVPALIFPGMSMTLTSTGGSNCDVGLRETFMIIGVHRYLGYVDVINAGKDQGPPYHAYWPWSTENIPQCTGTTVGQPSYSFVPLN